MKKISDKMRLDFLDKQEWPFNLACWYPRNDWRLQKKEGEYMGRGFHVRPAIDAAIRAERRKKCS